MKSDHADSAPPKGAVAWFLTCTSIFWFSHYTYVPTLAPYAEHRGGSFEIIGLIVSAYGLAQLLFRLPLGIYSDRIGRRKPFISIGLFAAGLAGLGLAMSPSPAWMIAARFVSGLSACSWVAFTVLYSGYYPPGQTARAMGHISFVNGLSIMTASFLGGWLADHHGWLAPFWASAAFGFLGTIVSLKLVDPPRGPSNRLSLQSSAKLLRHPTLIWSSIAASLGMYTVFTSSFGFLPNYALTLGASKTQLGLLSTITLLCGSIAGLSASRFALPVLGPRNAVVAAYSVVALVTAAIPHTTEVYQLFLLQSLSGLSRGTAYPIMMSLSIHGLPERDKATAMGFFQAVYSAGMFLGPVVAGQIGGWMGYTMLFSSSAVVAVISVGAALKLPRSIES
jgi:predicted MFS family arabinose efflux permease